MSAVSAGGAVRAQPGYDACMSTVTSARFPFLARLGEASQRELANLPISRASAGQHLLSRGDDAAGAYFVTSGALRVYYLTKDGREATLYRVEPGGTCILALTSTFNREPYPAWVDAGPQGAGFARLPAPAFRKMFDAEPEFRGFLFGVLSGRVFELMRTLEEAGTAQMEERVARYLTRNADADGVVRASQAGIAAELGTAREVVFRALRALTARGLVRTGRLRIQVLSLPRLRRAAKLAS